MSQGVKYELFIVVYNVAIENHIVLQKFFRVKMNMLSMNEANGKRAVIKTTELLVSALILF
jgi:hypothetical protein